MSTKAGASDSRRPLPSASRTAVLVCQGRAAADGIIAPDRFADPIAERLLRDDERPAVIAVRSSDEPKAWRDRIAYEMIRGTAEILVPRTVAIDDAISSDPQAQAVILGAGLDDRAWRLPALTGATVFEVDQPASQSDKRERASVLGDHQPVYVPVVFGQDDLRTALAAAGHRADEPTTWVWEGVVPYLTKVQVAATIADVAACSAPGSRFIINYQASSLPPGPTLLLVKAFGALAGPLNPVRTEPWRSIWTPAQLQALLDPAFSVRSDVHLLDLTLELGITPRHSRSLRDSRVLVAEAPLAS